MASERFAYVWSYVIEPADRSAFLSAYGPAGEWVELFSTDSSYLETILLQDDADENKYVTIDFWKSRTDRDSFRARHVIELDLLDSKCEAFTKDEQFLGDYVEVIEGRN